MKIVFTLVLSLGLSLSLIGQAQVQVTPQNLQQSLPAKTVKYTGNEVLPQNSGTYQTPIVEFRDPEIVIGNTNYDLQSNSTNCKRISKRPDGTIVGVWTQGFDDATSYPGRGTGYNARQNFAWSDAPTARLESERIGWPNHVFRGDGSEFIVSHTSNSQLLTLRRDALGQTWTEAYIPTNIPPGLLWPRAAVGGTDGQTIHVMAITTPVANEGALYEGVDGQIIYFRSMDGGSTWDQTDVIIPGLGAEFTTGSSADAYYIDARGENVAIGVFDDWGDVLLFKSSDNGDTWTKHILNDFPLDNYVINSGYTYEEIPPFEGERPDSMAIFSSDNYGSVVIDNDGMAHAFFGQMYIQDVDLTDAGSTYFPATDGIAYWNESFGDDSLRTIVSTIDQNANDTLDIADIADIPLYFASLTSMPSAGVDLSGNIYLTYAGVIEDRVSLDDDAQHYRHIYVVASEDGGETWGDPVDLITEDQVFEPTLVDFVEAVFPTMTRDVDSKVRLIYMQDFRPGLSVRGDEDEAAGNTINYFQRDVTEFLIGVDTEELVEAEAYQFKLAPTVTNDQTTISFNLPEGGSTDLMLVNMHGQMVQHISSKELTAGNHQEMISVGDLSRGIYYVMIRVNGTYSAIELVKQ